MTPAQRARFFPCTPADYNRIRKNQPGHGWKGDQFGGKHSLEGKSVREWVSEARAGWPRVPVPKDPLKAAEKVAAAWNGVTFEA